MSDAPLVSIMMPCFNAEATLPMALASIKAQTYGNWEAVIVDDGSTDGTRALLEAQRDPRMRVHRFAENRGRGAARQQCLDMVRGKYLVLLDADDWQYPERIRHQVEAMESEPKISMLSNGFVVLGQDGNVLSAACPGLRRNEDFAVRQFKHVGPPPLAFPPAIIRMSDARGARFNERFLRSQDSDFVLQFLLGRYYAVEREVLYVYAYNWDLTLANTMEGYKYRIASHLQFLKREPARVLLSAGKTYCKMGIYGAAASVGLQDRLVRRRWPPAPQATVEKFEEMQEHVRAYA
jgi:glycosyltransferase involved in cell wall biosynthesis